MVDVVEDELAVVRLTLTNNSDRFVNFSERIYPTMKVDGATGQSVVDFMATTETYWGVGAMKNEATAPGESETFGMAWALSDPTSPIELSLAPVNYGSGPTATWAGEA